MDTGARHQPRCLPLWSLLSLRGARPAVSFQAKNAPTHMPRFGLGRWRGDTSTILRRRQTAEERSTLIRSVGREGSRILRQCPRTATPRHLHNHFHHHLHHQHRHHLWRPTCHPTHSQSGCHHQLDKCRPQRRFLLKTLRHSGRTPRHRGFFSFRQEHRVPNGDRARHRHRLSQQLTTLDEGDKGKKAYDGSVQYIGAQS